MTTIPHPIHQNFPVEQMGIVYTHKEVGGDIIGGIVLDWQGKKYGIEWVAKEDRFMLFEAGMALKTMGSSFIARPI